ncbi:hypothetical protein GQ43DRAFT_422418 [Delitschia confertaspora ATCC 74209]|uniref:C2H2-type domain-containing protein n=1 Tax=Delitschia confertaspora ATCC 74209 TaxID=1513339 RepID=A0A9P4JFH1_9PLEO|nr:hypothetical protein GQ43DRAFT_422418 [Delitschia confertaspora ATCC 74209]
MGGLVVLAAVFTFLLGSVGAQSPTMDLTLPVGLGDTLYPDPDGTLAAVCQICGVAANFCGHFPATPFRRPTFTPETFLNHPEWPGDLPTYVRSPSPEPEPELERELPTHFADRQLLAVAHIRQLEENATTIRDETIRRWAEGVYNPGDRTCPPDGSRRSQRRLASRENGFPCTHMGCEETFNRQCDLRRHQRTRHLERNERPHKCTTCGEGFLYPKDLDRHKRTHGDGQTLLHCDIPGCRSSKGFSRRDNLLRHLRQKHPNTSVVMRLSH